MNSTRAGIAILKLLSLTVFSDRRCPVDDCEYIVPEGTPLCMHFTECHTTLESNHTPDNLAELIINLSPEHFSELQNLGLSCFLFKLICMYIFFNMTVCNCHVCTLSLVSMLLASFPGSRAWEEEREPGTHCSRMRQVPLVTCILLRYTKITATSVYLEKGSTAWLYSF